MDTNKKIFASWLLAVFVFQVNAQGNKYFIEFNDKTGTPYSLDNPSEFLTHASIARRARYSIPYSYSDLPVNPFYVKDVAAVPHTIVRYAIKWLNGVVVSFDAQANESAALAAIDALPCVKSKAKVRRYRRTDLPPDSLAMRRSSSEQLVSAFDFGGAADQASQLNIPCLHEKGYRGQGMVIAVLDVGYSGVPTNSVFDSLRLEQRLLGTRDFVNGGTNVYQGGEHGTMVLSCMAALKPGVAIGTAPKASYWLIRTEEGAAETISEEYNWIRGAEFADSVGCDVLTTSLGYTDFNDPSQNHTYEDLDGRTAPMSIAGTIAAQKGLFVLNAAGNEGDKAWHFVGVPGDADSLCTVGSVNRDGLKSAFSSVGPTADGRIKPDLVATGEGAWVCNGDAACFPANGTSFATPVLAGAVACYWQANRKLNNMRLLTRLKNNASNATTPNNDIGWGIPDVCVAVDGNFDFSAFTDDAGIYLRMQYADYDYVNVEICDMMGKQLYSLQTDGKDLDLQLRLPYLVPGVYIVSVETSTGKKAKKILKLDL